jgi:hypothetical protein
MRGHGRDDRDLGRLMNAQQTFRAPSAEIRHEFGRWLKVQHAAGIRFVVLEGLKGSGKSYLTDQPFALGIEQSVHIELDSFLRKPVDETTEYMAAIDADAANLTIMQMYRTAPIVIAEGPMAWPVVTDPPRYSFRRGASRLPKANVIVVS